VVAAAVVLGRFAVTKHIISAAANRWNTPETSMTKLTAKNRDDIGDRQFTFPTQRKEPLENASHVRNAVARFNQFDGVTDGECDVAWKRIQTAAKVSSLPRVATDPSVA